jgi:hypothetical protein
MHGLPLASAGKLRRRRSGDCVKNGRELGIQGSRALYADTIDADEKALKIHTKRHSARRRMGSFDANRRSRSSAVNGSYSASVSVLLLVTG